MKKEPTMQTWRVYKDYPDTGSWLVGVVRETTERAARCAALSVFGRTADEPEDDDAIGPDDAFHVVLA